MSTAAIVERIDAEETVEDLAVDYGVTAAEIEQAVLFEARRLTPSSSLPIATYSNSI